MKKNLPIRAANEGLRQMPDPGNSPGYDRATLLRVADAHETLSRGLAQAGRSRAEVKYAAKLLREIAQRFRREAGDNL